MEILQAGFGALVIILILVGLVSGAVWIIKKQKELPPLSDERTFAKKNPDLAIFRKRRGA